MTEATGVLSIIREERSMLRVRRINPDDVYELAELLTMLKRERFTGYVRIDFSQGTVGSVVAEDRARIQGAT